MNMTAANTRSTDVTPSGTLATVQWHRFGLVQSDNSLIEQLGGLGTTAGALPTQPCLRTVWFDGVNEMSAPTPDSPFRTERYKCATWSPQEPFFFADTLSCGAGYRLLVYIGFDRNKTTSTIKRVVTSITGLLLMNSKVLPAACKILK